MTKAKTKPAVKAKKKAAPPGFGSLSVQDVRDLNIQTIAKNTGDMAQSLAKLLLIEEDRLQRAAMLEHQRAWGKVDKAKAVGVDISSPEFHRYMGSPPRPRKWWQSSVRSAALDLAPTPRGRA